MKCLKFFRMFDHSELKHLITYLSPVPLILIMCKFAGQLTYVVEKVLLVNYHSKPRLAFEECVNHSSVCLNLLQRDKTVLLRLNAKPMFVAKDVAFRHYLSKVLHVMIVTTIYVHLDSVVWENVLSSLNPVLLRMIATLKVFVIHQTALVAQLMHQMEKNVEVIKIFVDSMAHARPELAFRTNSRPVSQLTLVMNREPVMN